MVEFELLNLQVTKNKPADFVVEYHKLRFFYCRLTMTLVPNNQCSPEDILVPTEPTLLTCHIDYGQSFPTIYSKSLYWRKSMELLWIELILDLGFQTTRLNYGIYN